MISVIILFTIYKDLDINDDITRILTLMMILRIRIKEEEDLDYGYNKDQR